jgi:hypothetical protein
VGIKKRRKPRKKESDRIIMTIYYDHKHEAIKTNHSVHALSAVKNAVGHMQTGHYKNAFTVEVVNTLTGLSLIVMTYVDMVLEIVYKYSPRGEKFK